MVKIQTNIPELTKALADFQNIPGSMTVNGRTYLISKVENVERKGLELIGRRFLGGLVIVFSLGIIYLCNPQGFQELFQKIKFKRLTAVLEETTVVQPKEEEKAYQEPKKTEEEPKKDLYSVLPKELQIEIGSHLPINDFIQYARVAKSTQVLVKDQLDINNARQVEFIDLLLKYFSSKDRFPKLMGTPKALYPILIKLNTIIKDLENKQIDTNQHISLLKMLFTALKTYNFNERSLLRVNSQQRSQFLEAVGVFIDYTEPYQDLYKKFASHSTKMILVQDFLNDIYYSKELASELYTNWSAELRKGVNLQDLKEKDEFYNLLTQLICFSHMGIHCVEQNACTVIDEQMPDVTLTQLNNYSRFLLNISTNRIDIRALRFIPTYTAWKGIDLCKKLDAEQLRLEFNKLYLEGINSSPKIETMELGLTLKWLGKFDWTEVFIRGLIRSLLNTPVDEQEKLLKKITYAIQGISESLLHTYIWHLSHRIKHDDLMPIFLKDWVKVCHDNVFLPKLDRILGAIERKDYLIPLIEEIKNFEEPRRSIYLKMIIRNGQGYPFYPSLKEIRMTFEECGVEIPADGAVTDLELIQHLSPVTPFIKALSQIKTKENFINVLGDLLNLPEETRKLRLRILLCGLSKFHLEEVKRIFESCDFDFDEFYPLSQEEFETLNRNFRGSLEKSHTAHNGLNELVMKHQDNPHYLRAIVYYCNNYLFFNPNIISENERRTIFAESGLDLDDYPRIYFSEWYAKEQEIYTKSIDQLIV